VSEVLPKPLPQPLPQSLPKSGRKPVRLLYLLPLGLFACLALVFLMQLESGVDPEAVPSALVGKPAPQFDLPPLAGMGPGLKTADLAGKVTVVNVFASWCAPCRQEHPVLTALAKDPRIRVVAIDYKDKPENAAAFLTELGSPYAAVGVDEKGRAAIDWGVYGVPETFVVGPDSIIRHKFIGPLTAETVASDLMPAIEKALTPSS
jgi:cytochrome c biogenesis protein CcmG/thiol:disulfide interchange protein DsbE